MSETLKLEEQALLLIPLSPNREKRNAEHARRKAQLAPTVFNPHYLFAAAHTADARFRMMAGGPEFRTMQMISTNHKRESARD